MIAILPVRFDTNTDPSTVWSDDLFNNCMRPSVRFAFHKKGLPVQLNFLKSRACVPPDMHASSFRLR
jgi:hypothetical protein